MNWADEPATWKQLKQLRQSGYTPDHRLTKTEASDLIRRLSGQPENPAALGTNSLAAMTEPGVAAYDLRRAVEKADRRVVEGEKDQIEKSRQELASAVIKRLEFWVDTCRETKRTLAASVQLHDLYQKHGCRFEVPSRKEVQCILDALDSAMPVWDRDHPELFYQTLELNFPELLRRR